MDDGKFDKQSLFRLLQLAPENVRLVFVAGAICEVFLVMLSFIIRRTAAGDLALQSTVVVLVKAVLYVEVGVGIGVVAGIIALTALHLLRRSPSP